MNNILISPKVDVDQVAAWTQGKLVIKGESLEDLCIKLQRKYDVTFIFRDEEIKQFRFTGILLDETLDQVLNAVKLTAPIEYIISGKSVYMSVDKKNLNNFSKHLK
jgi:ferric-dicitrate binding protein FerR (iron transport regulator)